MKAVVAAFNQEKALVGAFSVITNLRMELGCNFLKHYNQVTSLVRLQLLTSVGLELLDQPKYKCNVSMDFIRTVAKTVQFDIYKYLYDYC